MAGVRVRGFSGVQAFSTSTITMAQIRAASNHRVRVERIGVTFNGVSAGEVPVLVELAKQTTDGTHTGSITLVKADDDLGETIQSTGFYLATVEPTTTDVKRSALVHPFGGSVEFLFPPGRDLYINGGDRLGVLLVSPAQAGNCNVDFDLEE